MLSLANNGYTKEQVLTRANGPSAQWAFVMARLDYAFNLLDYFSHGVLTDVNIVLDLDSKIGTSMTFTLRADAVFDPFNNYLQMFAWLSMGEDEQSGGDGEPFAKFGSPLLRVISREKVISAEGVLYYNYQAHEALAELLDGDEITDAIVLNPGDNVVDKIVMLLGQSALGNSRRWNIASSIETIANPQVWAPARTLVVPEPFDSSQSSSGSRVQAIRWETGVSILTVIDDLCSKIGYTRYSDPAGVISFKPWRDPALEPVVHAFFDDGASALLAETSVQQDIFHIPNHLTLKSLSIGDEATTLTAITENRNRNSPTSQANLIAPDGGSLIRHKVESGVEATSQEVLQSKADRRMLDLISIPETVEWRSRLKPWQEPGDVIAVTRADLGYNDTLFQIRKISFSYSDNSAYQMTIRQVMSLS